MPAIKYIIVLPVEGNPYISGKVPTDSDESLKALQKEVDGFIELIGYKAFTIHPMFRKTRQWDIARQLLNIKSVKVWANEQGFRECCPNMAVLNVQNLGNESLCPHAFGNIALTVTAKVLETLKVSLDELKDTYDEDMARLDEESDTD